MQPVGYCDCVNDLVIEVEDRFLRSQERFVGVCRPLFLEPLERRIWTYMSNLAAIPQ